MQSRFVSILWRSFLTNAVGSCLEETISAKACVVLSSSNTLLESLGVEMVEIHFVCFGLQVWGLLESESPLYKKGA